MVELTHYELLGVPRDSDAKTIKAAYRRLTAQAHPDRPTGTDGLFVLVTAAYDELKDPTTRAAYDRKLATGTAQPPPTAHQRAEPDEAAQRAQDAAAQRAAAQLFAQFEAFEAAQRARRAEEERENSRQDWLDHRLDRRRARRLAVARLPAATVRAVWHHPRWGALTVVVLLVVGVGVEWGPALYHDFRCPTSVVSSPAGRPSADKLLAFAKAQTCRGTLHAVDNLYAPRTGSTGYPGAVNKEHPAPIYWDGSHIAWEGLATPPVERVAVGGVRGYEAAETPAGKAPTAFSGRTIIVEGSGACSYIDAAGPTVVPLKPCPAAYVEPAPAPAVARQFSGPPEKPNENLGPNVGLKLVPHGCVTLAAARPSSADRLPAFTLTTWEGAPLASWDPKGAALTAAVGDILTYEIAVPELARSLYNGLYYIDGTLTTGWHEGFLGNPTLAWKGEAPVCAGPPKAAPRGFAAGHWIDHNPVAPTHVSATPALSTTGCVTRPKNPKLSTLPAFTVTQGGDVVATWDAKTGVLRGPVGGVISYDFALSFPTDGRAHVAGDIGVAASGSWPVCP